MKEREFRKICEKHNYSRGAILGEIAFIFVDRHGLPEELVWDTIGEEFGSNDLYNELLESRRNVEKS